MLPAMLASCRTNRSIAINGSLLSGRIELVALARRVVENKYLNLSLDPQQGRLPNSKATTTSSPTASQYCGIARSLNSPAKNMRTILIVDGICTRGLAIIRYLSSTGEYHILVFSRNTTCSGATAASALPNVTLLLNRCGSGYDLSTFIAATQRCPSVLICSNAGNSESREGVQWGARLVQSAASAGAKHLVYLTAERERKQCSTDSEVSLLR